MISRHCQDIFTYILKHLDTSLSVWQSQTMPNPKPDPKPLKKMVSFYCDEGLWAALKERSELKGLSTGWLARKAIGEALIRWKEEDAAFAKWQAAQTPAALAPVKAQIAPVRQGRMFRKRLTVKE